MADAGRDELGDLGDDDAAHGVTDQHGVPHTLASHRVGDGVGVALHRCVPPFRRPAPVAGQIAREDAVAVLGQALAHELPAPGAVTHAVHEHVIARHQESFIAGRRSVNRAPRPGPSLSPVSDPP